MSVSLSIPFNNLLSSSFSLHPLHHSRLDFPSFTAGNLYRNEAKTRLCPTHDDRIRPTLWSTCRRTWHRTQAGVSLLNSIIAEILPVPKVRCRVFKMWKEKTGIYIKYSCTELYVNFYLLKNTYVTHDSSVR